MGSRERLWRSQALRRPDSMAAITDPAAHVHFTSIAVTIADAVGIRSATRTGHHAADSGARLLIVKALAPLCRASVQRHEFEKPAHEHIAQRHEHGASYVARKAQFYAQARSIRRVGQSESLDPTFCTLQG